MADYLLGIDNGCTMSKAAIFTLDGIEVAVASSKTATMTPRPGWFERDMDAMWNATAAAIREVLAKASLSPDSVACVACTGHGNGIYLVDEAGAPVRNAILSMDSRAQSYIDRWASSGIDRQVRPVTMQAIWAAQPNALLAWLKDNEPEVMQRVRWVFMAKDFVRFRLTGEVHAELTDMSGTSLLNVGTAAYDDALLETWGLADMRPLLPPLVQSADVCGGVSAQAASATGLREGTPVAGGMFDIDACGLATGLVDERQLCMIAGTWGNNQYISRTPVVSEDVFMTSCYSIPGYYLMLEGSATSASNLEWFVTQFFDAEKERAARAGTSVYDICNELVGQTAPEESRLVFLPFLYGSHEGPDATSCILGMTGSHTAGHVLRAIYEGIVFGHKTHVDRLLKFREMPETLRLAGGAARSEVWIQIIADVFQTPVQVPEGTELGALGAAICAAVAAQCYPGYREAIEGMVRFSRTQSPEPQRQTLYEQKYERYRQMLDALAPVWLELR